MVPDASDHPDAPDRPDDADHPDDAESYPMPLHARLEVRDLERSRSWYDAVGFETVYAMRAMAHVRFARYADVLLSAGDPPAEPGRGVTLSFAADSSVAADSSAVGDASAGGVDGVADRAREAGATVLDGPVDRPYNARELVLADPDGYRLTFTEQLDSDRSFEDVMGER